MCGGAPLIPRATYLAPAAALPAFFALAKTDFSSRPCPIRAPAPLLTGSAAAFHLILDEADAARGAAGEAFLHPAAYPHPHPHPAHPNPHPPATLPALPGFHFARYEVALEQLLSRASGAADVSATNWPCLFSAVARARAQPRCEIGGARAAKAKAASTPRCSAAFTAA